MALRPAIHRPSRSIYRWLCAAWAGTLATLFLVLAVRAVAVTIRIWNLDNLAQVGQLTIYNAIDGGGYAGLPVELGDYDGDGWVDLVLAPMVANSGPNGSRREAGEVHISPGDGKIAGVVDRSDLPDDRQGLTLWAERPNDMLGTELFTADFNGDGIDDLVLSAQNYDGPDGKRDNAGGVYVLLGKPGLLSGGTIDLRDRGPNIVRITGAEAGERLGIWVEAGDLDGDGHYDLILGADQWPSSRQAPDLHRGKVYVIYGRASFPSEIDLAEFSDEVTEVLGRDMEDHFGASLHSRDLNGDGRDELIVGAALNRLSAGLGGLTRFFSHSTGGAAGPDNRRSQAGDVYVFFSSTDGGRFPPLIDLSAPLPDEIRERVTTIYGAEPFEAAGEELTSGDFNGDGFNDLVVGALTASAPGPPLKNFAGRAYVIYWQEGLEGQIIDLATPPELPLPEGLALSTLYGQNVSDILGDTLSAGDFDHDGFDDLAVGIPHAAVNGREETGAVAIVLGRTEPFPRFFSPQDENLPSSLRIAMVHGHRAGDLMSYSMEARDYDADGYTDLYPNAMRSEKGTDNISSDAGAAYVVSGYRLTGVSLAVGELTPSVAPAGSAVEVRITGGGFTTDEDTRVLLGQEEIEAVRVVSSGLIIAEFPPKAAGPALDVTVSNRYGLATREAAFTYQGAVTFIRGDANLDGCVDITDPLVILNSLFAGVASPCADSDDANDDGGVDISDVIYILEFLFGRGQSPRPPFPDPGIDTTDDDLTCEF